MASGFIVSPIFQSYSLSCRTALWRNPLYFQGQVRAGVGRHALDRSGALGRRSIRCGLAAAKTDRSSVAAANIRDSLSKRAAVQEMAVESPRITLLYDGECPICMKEVRFLQSKDAGRGRIAFVDIAAPDYDPQKYAGVTFEQAMGRIHGILPDGSVVKKVDVFRLCYEAVGLGWLWAATSIPMVKNVANAVYDFWADRRLQWTGRGTLENVLAARNADTTTAEDGDCSERCVIDWDDEDDDGEMKSKN
jgi:predicted DCC family thiol-disulfide oxidoreductase YuxK